MFTLSSCRYLKLNLFKLQDAALEFDCDHWDYEAEKRASEPRLEPRSTREGSTTLRKDRNAQRNRNSQRDHNNSQGRNSWQQDRSDSRYSLLQRSPARGSNTTPLPLRPDGKLTDAEKDCRMA